MDCWEDAECLAGSQVAWRKTGRTEDAERTTDGDGAPSVQEGTESQEDSRGARGRQAARRA